MLRRTNTVNLYKRMGSTAGEGVQAQLYGNQVLRRNNSLAIEKDDRQVAPGAQGETTQKKALCCRIILAAAFISSIPLWILFEKMMTTKENEAILWLQKEIPPESIWRNVFGVFYTMFSTEVTLLVQIFLFLADDSLLAFKGALVYSVGVYIVMMMKLIMQDPRPYWQEQTIRLTAEYCDLAYAHPSTYVFNSVFFWSYTIYMRFWKFSPTQSKLAISLLYVVLFVCFGVQVLAMALFGLLYPHQAFLTAFYSVIYLIAVVSFDQEIMQFSEGAGFLTHSSRKAKFQVLFYALFLFVVASGIVAGMDDAWAHDSKWIRNVIDDLKDHCSNGAAAHNVTFLGNIETYNETAILFFLVGLCFGTSYSMTSIDVVKWVVHTPWYFRLLRAALGVGIGFGLTHASRWILGANNIQ